MWTSLFDGGTIVNGQIVSLKISSVEDILLDVFGRSMLHRASRNTQRAQPKLQLHSSRFVVETCDIFVENRTSSRLNSVCTVTFETIFELNTERRSWLTSERNICLRRCRLDTDTAWREGKKSHSYVYDSETATAYTRTSTFQDELAGRRTRFAWRDNCTLCLCATPAAESCQWLWKHARKSNWTARSFLHCADDSDGPDSVFEFEPGCG